jgi:very-short-patch-repair endonuclease/DNA polymerase III delta prime subunit
VIDEERNREWPKAIRKPMPPTIYSEIAAKLNFACHQSAFAFLRDLRIENTDREMCLDDVLVNMSSDPSFLRPKSWRLDRITKENSIAIKDRDVELNGEFLLALADAVRGTVIISVEKDGNLLTEERKPVELLAYNEWGGAGYMPELLAAFSMPNDPAVDQVLHQASLVLRKAGKGDGIDGYKAGSRQRVWEIASAIYSAIANLDLTYSVPSASFERDGQKIRLPSQVLDSRIATCLDCSMLFASALEQAGLNPIIALPKGHAVVGVWLQPEELTTIVIDEAETLRKRIQLKELVLIETTYVTSHPSPQFSKAVAAAMEAIAPDKDDTFTSAIDIRRARAHRIAPLGLKSSRIVGPSDHGAGEIVELPLEEAPALPDFDDGIEEEELPETPAGRLERWQRKLLDLTARNPLLNHKSTKTSLRLVCPSPGLLEDKLANGIRISIQSVPQPTTRGQDEDLHRQRTGEGITEEYAKDALERKQVLVDLPSDELARRAVEIYRKTQTALQEGGANTLFLALGFLLWKRDEKDDRRFRAPLILLPVTLERKSVRSGIRMAAHDDEPRFNTTLLEMLRKDFAIEINGLEGELPRDQSGIDVGEIWNMVRRAVKEAKGFEVVEDVVLGHFSFAKYLMWKDMVDRTDVLRENPIVKHLIDTPRDPYPSDITFVEAAHVDRQYKPSDLLTPLPADSSQMAAIATADRGKNFIIIGPPGTGKSQTISNLIAHMLGTGKTVLFVSEKTAALEVVYRRLKEIGLGRFCLELHSNKARKADVLGQLRNAWGHNQEAKSTNWAEEAERLRVLRDQLNRVVDRLHFPRRNGMTAHYAIGVKIRDEDLASRVTFSWPSADQHDKSCLEAIREAVEKLCVQAAAVGNVSDSPFQLVTKGDWSPQWEGHVIEQAGRLSAAACKAQRACDTLLESIEIEIPDRTQARLDALGDLAAVLTESYRKQTAYALEPEGPDVIEALGTAIQHLESYAKALAALSCAYEPMAWRKLDGSRIVQHWQDAERAWWPKSFFARRKLVKDMRNAGAQGTPDPTRDGPTLMRLRSEGEAIDRLSGTLSGFRDWTKHTTHPDALRGLKSLGERARLAISQLAADTPTLGAIRATVRNLIDKGNDLLMPGAKVSRAASDFLAANRELKDACAAFESIAGRSVRLHFAESDNALDAIRDTADKIARCHAELRDWCAWHRRRTEAIDLELGPLVDAIEKGRIPIDEIEATFEAAYCAWWSRAVIGEDDVLRTFSTPEHVAAIKKFREIDGRFQDLTAAYIAAKLTGALPEADDIRGHSSWGILRRELQKGTRHKPVRQLIQEIPEVLTTLAPCLMMSPLSVAQYLPAGQAPFDVVIFDEASQITIWDAVGSLARGRQAIIAGDPKQMPPTNFFARADDDPDGDVDIEGDLESILDEMLGASIPQRTLNLHYRSRRESLIAFSNSRYYDNNLVTFPAPIHPDRGVRLLRPEGFYARGKARHNEGEAKAVVAEILRRLTHEDEGVRGQSIGVVTFNTEQQALIENLLDDARSKDSHLEWAFSADSIREPVFVKNLETVQGDERDVILFSITYGPDQSGHVTMNFGPLNRDGGERRLNVAMTRARSKMLVYSTLSPDRIDLSRSQARAVTDLKHFLEYAERGPSALGDIVHGPMGDFESPFESAVSRALREIGWNVHPQVGVSAYRIDLGIVHPDKPGNYLAGIECDGAMYHSSAVARERDKIRQSVLEGLGWTLFRLWSTDWWTHQTKALDTLHGALTEHLIADRMKRKEVAQATRPTVRSVVQAESEAP